jgi:nicotinamidase/pyrazinamidase
MTALILVDLQNDFFPGGALAVKGGEEVLPAVRALTALPFDLKVATKDWHPPLHMSFASTRHRSIGEVVEGQILWPDHCVQGTAGSDFAPGWPSDRVDEVFFKGTAPEIDSYSTFFDNGHLKSTGLGDYLKGQGIHTVVLAGLATDYCLKYSVLDALKLGFKVVVAYEGCRGVNLHPGDDQKALKEMQEAGALMASINEIRTLL